MNKNIKIPAILFGLTLVISASLLGCQPANRERVRSPTEKHYELKGKVVSVEKERRSITIAHEDIKDYMPPMTMPFTVNDEWVYGVAKPGDEITATYVVDGTQSWLENIVVKEQTSDSGAPISGEGVDPKPGDEVPNFRLVNQDGKPVRIHDYKGKTLLLTFIFTRCQDPDQCTLMSSNFAAIDQLLQKETELHKRTHLLSVSFDTEYDTPKVLRSYGASYTGKYSDETFEHWEFATGTPDEVKGIAQFFGLRYYKDAKTGNEQMIHSLRTAVIGADSKVVKVYRGNEWKPDDVLKDLMDAARDPRQTLSHAREN
ncbi:MAG TPA: SCO family protein [Pyrinomonadaceae bacterium]|nr:SCO family protein [Pyrinomonadaceae bacterium]